MDNNPLKRNQWDFPPAHDPNQQALGKQPLVPVGQYLPNAPSVKPEAVPQYDPAASQKILGMPKDRFVSLLGTLAASIAPASIGGRVGAGMVRMSDMMRQERVGQGNARATGAKEKQTKAEALAKEKRAQAEKRRNQSPITKSFRVKDEQGKERDVPFSFNRDTSTWEKIPGMPGKEVKKEEDKTPSFSEKRQRAKELRQAEATALGVDPETGTPNADYPEVQVSVDFFNEKTNKSYVLKRTQGTPAVDKGLFEWGFDKEAIPGTIEKVPIKQFKTPEDVMNADYLSMAARRRLLLKLFPDSFGD